MRPWYLYVKRKIKIPIGIAILFADSGSIKITFIVMLLGITTSLTSAKSNHSFTEWFPSGTGNVR